MDEKQLIRLAQQGDAPAAEQLVKAWYQPVFAYFYKNTGQYHLSKDLTQETFLLLAPRHGHGGHYQIHHHHQRYVHPLSVYARQ